MLCFEKLPLCKTFKKSIADNKERIMEISYQISPEHPCSLEVLLNILDNFYPPPDDWKAAFVGLSIFDDMRFNFYASLNLSLMGYYKQSRILLRCCLENIFRLLYLRNNPVILVRYIGLKNSENDEWASLTNSNIKKHYRKMQNASVIQKKVEDLAQELSSYVHSYPRLGKEVKLVFNYLDYNKERLRDCLNLIEKTHRLCIEMVDFEIENRAKYSVPTV